ncbi:DnaA N-terminal domain-containing protein, partial [Trinickia sp. LjRoot230]|uniref:DnaA N-terminal domain-containing protein n=1 Tax=Trinickia sp. LjRoot230 TaxID=3342288 RepID=UPI003F508700
MNEFWQHCSALLERELTPQQYVTWIKPLAPVAFDAAANTLSIAAPNRFKLDWVKSQFSGRISDLARDFWQAPVEVQFVLDPKASARATVGASSVPLPRVPASVSAAASMVTEAAVSGTRGNAYQNGVNGRGNSNGTNGANGTQPAHDAADIDLPMVDASEAAAARRTWRPGVFGAPGGAETDSMYERSKLNPVLTFDNFVTGKANQLARAAAVQ